MALCVLSLPFGLRPGHLPPGHVRAWKPFCIFQVHVAALAWSLADPEGVVFCLGARPPVGRRLPWPQILQHGTLIKKMLEHGQGQGRPGWPSAKLKTRLEYVKKKSFLKTVFFC
jgi:hypothetical protein